MPAPLNRCHAHSTRTGLPCRRYVQLGAKVCASHGGAAVHVQEAARRRLLELVAPAVAELAKLVRSADSDSTKLRAIESVLDRTGLKAADLLQVNEAIEIRVSYTDTPLPWSEQDSAVGTRGRNGHALSDGR